MTTSSLPPAPRVFISHASEDRARFVEPLAHKLRADRVDAWVSFWEMGLGDRLPDKVFEVGMGEAVAVVVVLSAASVDKPWVRAELEVATALRIAEKIRLIPVVLDDTPVPVQLLGVLWHRVPAVDAAGIDAVAKAITDAVYGVSARPPLGDAPGYVRAFAAAEFTAATGLTPIDAVVLREAARQSLEHPYADHGPPPLAFDEFAAGMAHQSVSVQDVADAVAILVAEGYVQAPPNMTRPTPSALRVTTAGMDAVIVSLVDDYASITRRVAAAIVNDNLMSSPRIAEATSVPRPIVHHVLRMWRDAGWLRLTETIGPVRQVYGLTPQLRRWLQG